MRNDIRHLPIAVLVATLGVAGASAGEKAGAGKKPDTAPLVRMDLLKVVPPEPSAPIRDIFSTGRAVAAPEAVTASDDLVTPIEGGLGVEAPPEGAREPSAPDLTYLGYVTSGRKIIALVISEGQALAVAEGEEIVPGLKVARIAPDRIEVTGPDGKRTSVPIQGEQP